jgi:Omp85 superfamily domain
VVSAEAAARAAAAVGAAAVAAARTSLLLLLLFAGPAWAQPTDKRSLFTDPEDGKLDASEWLLERKGFLPVPILITEPAVGYGVGAALLFFRESIGEAVTKAKESSRLTPPDIYGMALAATENGTKVAGAFGMVTFAEQLWRWRGAVARPDVNLDFYGTNGTDSTRDLKLGYNVEGWISTQQVMRRLGESENFVGARWIYLDLDTRFDASRPDPVLAPGGRAVRSSGLGLSFEHDSRDNFFTPSSGWKGYLESMFYSPDLGSDNKYQTYRAYAFSYFPLAKEFILGVRADARVARGDVPFYQLPFIELRGIPVARYQDENAGVAEAELRWNATPRWALIGFLGAGRAWGSSTKFGDADTVTAWGVGFRYLIARRLGIYMGLDVAKGPEETALYIQAGSAWR